MFFSASNTSGEKAFEEFFTDLEEVDFDRLSALGIITNKIVPDRNKIEILFTKLNRIFAEDEPSKVEIVQVIKEYLPNFKHIETGKSLDSKM